MSQGHSLLAAIGCLIIFTVPSITNQCLYIEWGVMDTTPYKV